MSKFILLSIVTYNPSREFTSLLKSNQNIIKDCLVIDNSDNISIAKSIEEECKKIGAIYIPMLGNKGIAAALNTGLIYANENDFLYLCTLDQDSILPEYFLDKFVKSSRIAKHSDPSIGIFAPIIVDKESQQPMGNNAKHNNLNHIYTNQVITSGCVISVPIAHKIGNFWDELFIDYVDFEFCLRCRLAGVSIVILPDLSIEHSVGNPKAFKFFGRNFFTSSHSPVRRYYLFRNRIAIYKRYIFLSPKWVLGDIINSLKDILKIILLESESKKNLRYIIRGIYDGILSRLGKIKE